MLWYYLISILRIVLVTPMIRLLIPVAALWSFGVVWWWAGLCKSITTFGIGGTWTATTPYQYYTFLHSERPDGNPTHSFSAEQALVRHLADSGIIRMCTSKVRPGPRHLSSCTCASFVPGHALVRLYCCGDEICICIRSCVSDFEIFMICDFFHILSWICLWWWVRARLESLERIDLCP